MENNVNNPADLNEEQKAQILNESMNEPNGFVDTNDRIINLSFDDNSVKFSRLNERTIASMVSYFRADKLCKFMNYLGYTNIPDIVTNTLKEYGYVYNYKLAGYTTKTTGIVILDPRDEDEQVKANNMAITKAKVKAYDRAARCLCKIRDILADTMTLFEDAAFAIGKLYADECDALDRVIETGYCNPDKN